MKVEGKMRLISRTSCTVHPAIPAGQGRVMELSGADQFVRPRHVPILLFYAAREGGQAVLPTQLIKDALAQLLVLYYPNAGRLRRRPDGKLELVCNDAGAEFVEAVASGNISDLGDFGPNPLYTQLLDPGPSVVGDAVLDCPITYVQVTRFACGGASLMVSGNHTCLDGLSVNMLINSLSEIARGKEVSRPPVHNRALLKARGKCDPTFQPSELRPIPDVAVALPKLDPSLWPAERMFVFSPSQIKRIKLLATEGGGGQVFTTFESINAHIWRSITRARGLEPHKKTKFLTTLDARRRFEPGLPKEYFGNCICFVNAIATAGDIVKSLLFTAKCIREAIGGFTNQYMNSVLAFAEESKTPLVMNVNAGESAGHDVSCASWVQMNFMEADMGSGKPVFASPGNNPFDGSVLMLPSHKGQGYINVFVGLKRENMERLITDPEFFSQE